MPADAPPAAPAAEPATPTPGAAPAAGQLDAAALRRLWPEVLEIVKLASRRTKALLDNAQITGASGELVTLSAPVALARMISDDSNTSILRDALTKVVGGTVADRRGARERTRRVGRRTITRGAAPAARDVPPEPDPRDDPDFEAGAAIRPRSSIPRPRR